MRVVPFTLRLTATAACAAALLVTTVASAQTTGVYPTSTRTSCGLPTLKGTYGFSMTGPADFTDVGGPNITPLGHLGVAGFLVFDGLGRVTAQQTDNDGGGSGALGPNGSYAPPLGTGAISNSIEATVADVPYGHYQLVGTTGCVFHMALIHDLQGTPLFAHYTLYAAQNGSAFQVILTSLSPDPSFPPALKMRIISTYRAERFASGSMLTNAVPASAPPLVP